VTMPLAIARNAATVPLKDGSHAEGCPTQ